VHVQDEFVYYLVLLRHQPLAQTIVNLGQRRKNLRSCRPFLDKRLIEGSLFAIQII
jgi:hypothetical protein